MQITRTEERKRMEGNTKEGRKWDKVKTKWWKTGMKKIKRKKQEEEKKKE